MHTIYIHQWLNLLNKKGNLIPIDVEKRSDNAEYELLQKRLDKIKKKYTIAKNAYLAEIDTLEEYKKNKEEIQKEEKEIIEKLNNLKNETQVKDVLQEKISTALELINSDERDVEKINKALKSFIKEIIVNNKAESIGFKLFV